MGEALIWCAAALAVVVAMCWYLRPANLGAKASRLQGAADVPHSEARGRAPRIKLTAIYKDRPTYDLDTPPWSQEFYWTQLRRANCAKYQCGMDGDFCVVGESPAEAYGSWLKAMEARKERAEQSAAEQRQLRNRFRALSRGEQA